jgi:hypothetical protein
LKTGAFTRRVQILDALFFFYVVSLVMSTGADDAQRLRLT